MLQPVIIVRHLKGKKEIEIESWDELAKMKAGNLDSGSFIVLLNIFDLLGVPAWKPRLEASGIQQRSSV